MFIVFEGIDGSGKTTLSNRVAAGLRESGRSVEHVREGGRFASTVTQAIRELSRDARHVEIDARTELLLYCAREAQLLEEATIPALRKKDVVIADRFLYTPQVLACDGRGLPLAEVSPIVEACARGVQPDLVILVDVDPHVARARRKVSKLGAAADGKPGSRKGLAGAGLQHRLRAGYRELAATDPRRWIVLENEEADLDALVTGLVELINSAFANAGSSPSDLARMRLPAAGGGIVARQVTTAEDAAAALLEWVDRRAEKEPGVAAYFLAGLAGGLIDERRLALATRVPEVIAAGLRGLDDDLSWRLRETLALRAPAAVARSLAGDPLASPGVSPRAEELRQLLAEIVPAEVIASLNGRDDETAWEWRTRLGAIVPDAVASSLRRVPSERAWSWREQWLEARGGLGVVLGDVPATRILCDSLIGLDDDRAWEQRKAAKLIAPVPALASVRGCTSDASWKWRRRWVELAPKTVFATLAGLDDERAWVLRERMGTQVKEAIDSLGGLDGERVWRLREACADVWPSTVLKGLGQASDRARAVAFLTRQLTRHPGRVSLWKHATAFAAAAQISFAAAG